MEKEAVRYLLLGLGVGFEWLGFPSSVIYKTDNAIKKQYNNGIKIVSNKIKIDIMHVCIKSRTKVGHNQVMYMFKFPSENRDDDRAQKIADAVISSYTLLSGPFPFEPASTFRFPTSMLKKGNFLIRDELLDLDERKRLLDEDYSIEHSFDEIVYISADNIISIWDITPLMMEKDLSKAMMYLRASFREFYVYPGVVPEVLGKSEESPKLSYIKAKFENALLNAFKAIEALIGEPPKNNNKFFKRLSSIGVNPKYNYGYPNYKPIYKVIREMSHVRDKKAAHGSIPKRRDITYFELMDYQLCARLIVIKTIQKRLGRAILMFPKIKD